MDVVEAIGVECEVLDRSFSWWVVNACRAELARGRRSAASAPDAVALPQTIFFTEKKGATPAPRRVVASPVVRASSLSKVGVKPIPKGKS